MGCCASQPAPNALHLLGEGYLVEDKRASMFNIAEIRADGAEQIINSTPYRSEGEA